MLLAESTGLMAVVANAGSSLTELINPFVDDMLDLSTAIIVVGTPGSSGAKCEE